MTKLRLASCFALVLIVLFGAMVSITLIVCGQIRADPEVYRQAIHDAAATGNVVEIRRVVWWCPDALSVRYNEHSGDLPIHTAVAQHRFESVRELVELGSNLDTECSFGETPLYRACFQDDLEIALYLISKGAKVNGSMFNPLHAAAFRGNASVVSALLTHGADIDLTNRSGTALHMAASGNQAVTMKLLLDRGAKLDVTNCDGLTAQDLSALKGYDQLVSLLLKMGARKTVITAIHDGNIEDVDKCIRECPQLADEGARFAGQFPLHYAARFGQTAICKYLVEKGFDRTARDRAGFVAAHRACYQGNKDVLRAVCSAEVCNAQRDNGDTPLHICADKNNVELGKVLVFEFNADLNSRARHNVTPLLRSMARGSDAFSEFLIENGADVNATRLLPQHTPLHYAVFDPGKPKLAELLLSKGANPHAKGVGGLTPSEIAERRPEMKALFERHRKQ